MQDQLIPPEAFTLALAQAREAYAKVGAADALQRCVDETTGHMETPAMRNTVLNFLQHYLS